MKTLLQQQRDKRDYDLAIVQEKEFSRSASHQGMRQQSHLNMLAQVKPAPAQEGSNMILRPLNPKMNRITSSHISTKLIKRIETSKSKLQQVNDCDQLNVVGQQIVCQQDKINLPQFGRFINEDKNMTYSVYDTQKQAQRFNIIQSDKTDQTIEDRAQTAPVNKKRQKRQESTQNIDYLQYVSREAETNKADFFMEKPIEEKKVRDLKEMVQLNGWHLIQKPVPVQPQKQFKQQEYMINDNVHKHLKRLQSSTSSYLQMPFRTVGRIEKELQYYKLAYITSDKVLKAENSTARNLISAPPVRQNKQIVNRPISQQQGPPRQKSTQNAKSALTLQNAWVDLQKKVMEGQQHQGQNKMQVKKSKVISIDKLNLQSDILTHQEKDYIKQKKHQYFDDMKSFIETKQASTLEKKQNLLYENSRNILNKNSLLSNIDFDEFENENNFDNDNNDKDVFDMIEDPIEIDQNGFKGDHQYEFFDDAKDLNESYKKDYQETCLKFEQLIDTDQKQQRERDERQAREPEQFLKVGQAISDQEVGFMLKEYKKDIELRNYDCKLGIFFYQFQYLIKQPRSQNFFQNFQSKLEFSFQGYRIQNIMTLANISLGRGTKETQCILFQVEPVMLEQKIDDPVVVTLYDGSQFGELALIDSNNTKSRVLKANVFGKSDPENKINYTMQDIKDEIKAQELEKEQAKNWWKKDQEQNDKKEDQNDEKNATRSASIETAESTYLFTISREYFKSILLNLITQELEDKLKTLLVLSCFDFMSPMSLIPIAKLIESKIYKLGEIILKEGEPQKFFFLVAKGRCKIVKEEVIIRDTTILGISKKLKKKKLNFALMDYNPVVKDRQRVKTSTLKGPTNRQNDPSVQAKSFQYEQIYQDQDYVAFRYHQCYGDFVRGDFFMGRALMSEYRKLEPSLNDVPFNIDEPARLTVVLFKQQICFYKIADAAVTEIYLIEKTMLHLIPNPLKKMLMDAIMMKKEFDHFFDIEEAERVKKWDHYKTDLFKWTLDIKQQKFKQ